MRRRNAVTTVLTCTFGAALLVVLVGAGVWRAEGGRWFDVRTASMGRAAPVGTLLLTRPTTVAQVHVGDIITFRAPGSGLVYSHRVVAKAGSGLTTRGDVNPTPDAWTIHDRDLVGIVAHRVEAVGWVLRGLPLLLLCLAVVWLVSVLVRRSLRDPVRVMGSALSLAVLGLVLHPWVALQRIGMETAGEGVVIRTVSTGLLPVKVFSLNGPRDPVRLVNGQVGDVAARQSDAHGHYALGASLSLGPWWWVLLIGVSLLPMLWCLLVGLEPEQEVVFVEPLEPTAGASERFFDLYDEVAV